MTSAPATSLARSVLYQKSIIARAHASEIGKRAFGHPVSLEHRWRAAEAWRRFNAMSQEDRREYYFAKRAKYLINCLTTERYRRVFRLRCEGDDGKMVYLETWIHKRAHPVTLLLKLMRMPHAPLVLRLDCAKTAARYLHRKPKARIVVAERLYRCMSPGAFRFRRIARMTLRKLSRASCRNADHRHDRADGTNLNLSPCDVAGGSDAAGEPFPRLSPAPRGRGRVRANRGGGDAGDGAARHDDGDAA
jgi:hypothetical protein